MLNPNMKHVQVSNEKRSTNNIQHNDTFERPSILVSWTNSPTGKNFNRKPWSTSGTITTLKSSRHLLHSVTQYVDIPPSHKVRPPCRLHCRTSSSLSTTQSPTPVTDLVLLTPPSVPSTPVPTSSWVVSPRTSSNVPETESKIIFVFQSLSETWLLTIPD